jgi:hypothetical protein
MLTVQVWNWTATAVTARSSRPATAPGVWAWAQSFMPIGWGRVSIRVVG